MAHLSPGPRGKSRRSRRRPDAARASLRRAAIPLLVVCLLRSDVVRADVVVAFSSSTSSMLDGDEEVGIIADQGREYVDDFDDDPDCRDDRPSDCPGARHRGECWTMWESTLPACRASCWLCVNATELRARNVAEDEIRRRRAFSRTDFGPLPSFPPHPNPRPEVLRTRQVVAAMDAYARQFPHKQCANARAECPYWAVLDQCRTNYGYMVQECPLACRYCDERAPYLRCSREHLSSATDGRPRKRRGLPVSHFSKWKEWALSSSGARNVLEAVASTDQDWAVLLDSFVTPEEREEIRSDLLPQMTFQRSAADGYDLHDTLPLHSQSDPDVPQTVRRTSASAYCDLRCIQQHPALQSALKRLMKLLRVPSTAFLERPIEFVTYGPRDTFATHSDCRVHDAWRAGGYRAATAYLALDGTATTVGFPHFWEMVPVREGQMLVWPNVRADVGVGSSANDQATTAAQGQSAVTVECSKNMTSEVLASPGTSRGMVVHVRMHPMDESLPAECR